MTCLSFYAYVGDAGETVKPEITFVTASKNIYCYFDPNEQNFWCERLKPALPVFQQLVQFEYEDAGNRIEKIDFVLAYGKSWKAPDGQITCQSKRSGLTGKGSDGFWFALSKSAVKKFEL